MVRTDGDSWDLVSSVGATATMAAAQRAVATIDTRPLINDPFAEPLVSAIGVQFFTRFARGELDMGGADTDPARDDVRHLTNGMSVRTKFFDEFFLDGATRGIGQAVILASGLDTRAYRLPWPSGTTVFEIDQPGVIDFKTRTLATLDAEPTTDHRPLALDLRNDWPAALLAAGFDPNRPTVWSAEGLLAYLPPAAQDRLLDDLTRLSASGSRLATDTFPDLSRLDSNEIRKRTQAAAARWRNEGFEEGFHIDVTELMYFDERSDVAAYLADRGWALARSICQIWPSTAC